MATKRSIKINKLSGLGHEVLLDGTDIGSGIDSLTITLRAGQPANVELNIPIVDITELQDPEARVYISPTSRAALEALGWTPPGAPTEPVPVKER